MKKLLVTGSSGLVGSEMVSYFSQRNYQIHGIDNNQRSIFFGPAGDTRWNQKRLEHQYKTFIHHEIDIRDRHGILALIKEIRPDAIVHAAAQPSHDKAASIPFDDFDTNAVGTLNLLEAARLYATESPFVFLSTNKVYGDAPNKIFLKEESTRWTIGDDLFQNGIPESFTIDQSKHSLFGASKVAADVMVQEYGRYFSMPTVCLRGGCLTGPNHSGVELHGFLSYLIKCNLEHRKYIVFGYKGKQVRDNIHSFDIARLIELFIESPRIGQVYNLGGGFNNTCSIIEAFEIVENITGVKQIWEYTDLPREGDHMCYYSDLRKLRSDFPNWDISIGLNQIFEEIVQSWKIRSNI